MVSHCWTLLSKSLACSVRVRVLLVSLTVVMVGTRRSRNCHTNANDSRIRGPIESRMFWISCLTILRNPTLSDSLKRVGWWNEVHVSKGNLTGHWTSSWTCGPPGLHLHEPMGYSWQSCQQQPLRSRHINWCLFGKVRPTHALFRESSQARINATADYPRKKQHLTN